MQSGRARAKRRVVPLIRYTVEANTSIEAIPAEMRGAVLYQLPFEKQNILLAPGGDISRGLELKFDLAWMRVYVCVPEEDDAQDDCGYRTTLPLLGWRQLRSQLLVREPKDPGVGRGENVMLWVHY